MTQVEKFAVEIAEIFEQFLEERDVRIPSSEEEKEMDNDCENGACIYGQDWGNLTEDIGNALADILTKYTHVLENYVDDMDVVACDEHAQAVFQTDVLEELRKALEDAVWLDSDGIGK